jgi:hypothetical protein
LIKKALIYFVAVTAVLFAARALHYHGLLKQKRGYYAKYKTAFFEKNDFDVLFLGSSRVEMHYNTYLFDSLTGKNSFNLSLAGATPQTAFAALKAYLVNSKVPKEIFYEIDFHFIRYYTPEIKEFNNYFPFLKNQTLREQFSKIDPRMDHFFYDPYFSLPYTGFKNFSTSLHGWLNIPNKTDSLYYKGYLKEIFRPHLTFLPTYKIYSFFNPVDRSYLDSIISISKKNNVKLSLISSPMFAGGVLEVANKKQILNNIRNIAAINNISYYNFSTPGYCNQRKLFVDHYHMNSAGAQKFTLEFARFYNNIRGRNALK